jgi:hypothetical protein
MWAQLLWKLIWILIVRLLGITKDFVNETISAVEEANTHDIPNEEKFEYVKTRLILYLASQTELSKDLLEDFPTRIFNLVIELAVNYVKSKK